MNKEWSLDVLYKSFQDPDFLKDLNALDQMVEDFHTLSGKVSTMSEKEGLLAIVQCMEKMDLVGNLFNYVSLRQSTNTTDPETTALYGRIMTKYTAVTKDQVIFNKFIGNCKNLNQWLQEEPVLTQYTYRLQKIARSTSHLLADDVEEMFSLMDMTGGQSWGTMFDYLTSTVKIDFNGTSMTLSDIRNLAYDPNEKTRRNAYEAELAGYEKIKDPISFSLNNIKKQVSMEARMRGYASPLSMTLEQIDMKQETLDALWTACRESLPAFHSYMRRKGELLGHKNGLPWYDMFAPLGTSNKKYTTEEAKDYLLGIFSKFSPDMAEMMDRAFQESWIDFFPHEGKVGGAFCANLTDQKQSRVLTNFDGSLSAIDTLAHELGHAYHGLHIEDQAPLNRDYSMPVAETASTFNENVFMSTAIADASPEEKVALLDSLLQEQCQTICDIYSRFLFEDAVFNRCDDEFLFADQLKEIMLDAQQQAYGDGLDSQYMHPFMWTCKGHYYSSGLSYYNFPYAFGALFAKGLYSMYLEQGADFVPKYQALLHDTTVKSVEDAAMMVGADLTKPDFWRNSLKLISQDIDEFLNLTK